MAMSTQGIMAMTTIIIMRLRSSASRTCVVPFVTDAGVKRKVSVASKRGWNFASGLPGAKCRPACSSMSWSVRHQASFSRRASMARSSGP